ncbi:cupin domain-containing protein [Streptomyces sp. NPDC058052]|uniref:cupin domain-containing protein n=1 Tax=Streptomyces sp. NPDC058052 TaxID=3346316 RepID=UPI0036ECAA10
MSTVSRTLQGTASDAESGVLETRLIGLSREEFAVSVWGRAPLITRGSGDFSDLFSASAVDELVSRRGLRTPFLRVAKGGSTAPESSFTSPGGVGASVPDQLDDTALWRSLADGSTLVLQALQRTWQPITDFVARLGTELGHPVQANAYVTPPQNRGFDDHYDVHDVFVLQVTGTKRWMVHEPVHPAPLRDQPWTAHRAAVAEAARSEARIDTVLEPGDVLYLPRGWLHAAEALGTVSIHLTLGIHTWTRHALAQQLAESALSLLREDVEMRESLALGVDGPGDEVDFVRRRLVAALAEADPAPLFHRDRRGQARPAPMGPLAQLRAVANLAPDSPVRLREALEARLEGRRLITRAGWLDLTEADIPSTLQILGGGTHPAGTLGLPFVERLLRAGVLVPAGS